VEVTVLTSHVLPSKNTLVPGAVSKFVPVRVTVVPPVTDPKRGLIDLSIEVI
jgi:hypothetical protein